MVALSIFLCASSQDLCGKLTHAVVSSGSQTDALACDKTFRYLRSSAFLKSKETVQNGLISALNPL